jgi:Fe-S-cluster containining protein
MDLAELKGVAFRCLEGCGFCCTFAPEVAHDELARLRHRFPALPVARSGEGMRLALQGGCGACTLLSRRACTAYGERPAHCRYFPFHLYFGRRTEACLDRSCRGVADQPGGDLEPAFREQVLAVARPYALVEHERQARRVHQEFEANARLAGAWGDADAAAAAVLAAGVDWEGPEVGEAWEEAWAPFALEDPVERPFHLDAGLRWLTFHADGDRVAALEMQEDGSLEEVALLERVPAPRPGPEAAAAIGEVLRRLVRRDCFFGGAAALVDASDYEVGLEQAARLRLAAMACDLAVRAHLLRGLGLPVDADELGRSYDAAFLDAPTIGGWL